ncbi:hypothetical protein EMCRGX_G008343 [Ephydatia muelleri]
MSTHLQIMLTTTLLPPSCDCLPHTQLSPTCTTTISLTSPTLTAYHTNITPGSQLPHTCTHNTQCTHLHLYMYTNTSHNCLPTHLLRLRARRDKRGDIKPSPHHHQYTILTVHTGMS